MTFRSIRSKTVLALVTVALVPSTLLGIVWYRVSIDGILANVNGLLAGSASRAAAAVDGFLEAQLSGVRTHTQLPTLAAYLHGPQTVAGAMAPQALDALWRADTAHIAGYALYDADGRRRLVTDAGRVRHDAYADSLVHRALGAAGPVMDAVRLRSENPKDATFMLASAVRATGGRVLGVLLVEYRLAVLDTMLRAQARPMGETAQAILYDANNIRLAGTIDTSMLFRTTNPMNVPVLDSLRAVARLRPPPDSAALVTVRRVARLRPVRDSLFLYEVRQARGDERAVRYTAAIALLGQQPWRVAIELPRASAIGPTERTLVRDAILLFAVVLLMALLLAGFIAGSLTRPLLALTATAKRFADGDLEARVAIDAEDEVGRLGQAMNDLADRVGSLVVRLAQRTHELEEDIAQRERLEHELAQTRRLEAVGKLAGGVAHDFNNILTVIAQNAELAQHEAGVPAPVREALADIDHAALRGAELTRQLLAFAKRGSSSPRLIDVADGVRATERLVRQLVGSHIRVQVELPAEPACVLLDPVQLEQVLVNLASNARDAMPRGGTLRLAVAVARASSLGPDGEVVIEVSDTGHGMAPEVQSRVFEPFFSTKEASRGTGLGLSTVYGIVAQASGTIRVLSVPGAGATFRIALPRRFGSPTPIGAPDSAEPAPTPTRPATILLVEDEPALRQVAARGLRRHGHTVHEATDGAEGLALGRLHGERLDLLLTDVVMPELDGYSLALTLATEFPALRVLLMSGYSEEARAQVTPSARDFPLIEKPFAVDALARRVSEVLGDVSPAPA